MQSLAEKRAAAFVPEPLPIPRRESTTVIQTVVQRLAEFGVEHAFGVSGGAIALLFDALVDSSVELHHFRHESGAAFAATEAHFASGKPTVVFATTGPGLLNALTGITAARWDGAKVILISGATNSPQRGRWATQETSSYTMPQDFLYSKGTMFDLAVRLEQAAELPVVLRRLANGLARPGGFVAHLCLPMSVQSGKMEASAPKLTFPPSIPAASTEEVAACARRLREQPFAIWAGFGATAAAPLVRRLAERSGAKVFCSPRAKGILPENHPQYLGVTGLGGHDTVTEYMLQQRPKWTLVLGTRLGEATSFWDRDLLPSGGFVHVDLDPDVPGTAYPDATTCGIQAEIGQFLEDLLPYFPHHPGCEKHAFFDSIPHASEAPPPPRSSDRGPVRPQVLMKAIQRQIVHGSEAIVLAECGNSFAWCNHHLRFPNPGRYRVSTLFGSMGHTAAGVVGAALGRSGKAVAVVGDGSMLMNSELSSAAQYGAQAVWIVLNDSGYGMCRDGHRALGLTGENVEFPTVDFVEMARALGANGTRVDTEDMLEVALAEAMNAPGPFVVDVRIDPQEASPLLQRFESLIQQGNSKNVAGWET